MRKNKMPISKEFIEMYGNLSRSGLNKAIRAEIPAMNEVLDALSGLQDAIRHEQGTRTGKLLQELYNCLADARDAAVDLIKNKYYVPETGQSKWTVHKTSPNWKNFTAEDE